VQDIGGQVQYINTKSRWNWGALGAHVPIPYVTAGYGNNPGDPAGFAINQNLVRVTFDQFQTFTQYPLNVAQRFEFGVGASRQSATVQTFSTLFDGNGQAYAQRREGRQRIGTPLNTFDGSAAFVGDYSVFGLTAPIAGARYRFEVAPRARRPQVHAADRRLPPVRLPAPGDLRGARPPHRSVRRERRRLQHADSASFFGAQPLFLNLPGFNGFVRGYDYNSIDPTVECPAFQNTQRCPVLERLIGSRVASASLEMRVPLLAPAGLGLIPTNFLPIDIVPFADAGIAWAGNDRAELRFVTGDNLRANVSRIPVVSAGVSARINLLGFAVVETYYARRSSAPTGTGCSASSSPPGGDRGRWSAGAGRAQAGRPSRPRRRPERGGVTRARTARL
jgi:hypothetical protein